MATRKIDPRIDIVVDTMFRIRTERVRRMIEVRDMRKKIGRVTLQEEARAIIEELDKHDARMFDAAIFAARINGEQP